MPIYHHLTGELYIGRLRLGLCGGQAVLMHRLVLSSKDGAWIVREDHEALDFTRPPRLGPDDLEAISQAAEQQKIRFTGIRELALDLAHQRRCTAALFHLPFAA